MSAARSFVHHQKPDTTKNPVTDPPLKASENAFWIPDFALSVTRTFAMTAVCIPKKAASEEAVARTTKTRAIKFPKKYQSASATATPTTNTDLNCLWYRSEEHTSELQ